MTQGHKSGKKNTVPKTTQQCLESISNMFAFDWTIKDIANLKHNPCKFHSFLTFSDLPLYRERAKRVADNFLVLRVLSVLPVSRS